MIKHVTFTSHYKRDIKKIIKQGKDIAELEYVINKLINSKPLETKYRSHMLSNNWAGFQECHIRPDWLLIYKTSNDSITLYRTGSHASLFKK
jgi:mRNA interferase YafQ